MLGFTKCWCKVFQLNILKLKHRVQNIIIIFKKYHKSIIFKVGNNMHFLENFLKLIKNFAGFSYENY